MNIIEQKVKEFIIAEMLFEMACNRIYDDVEAELIEELN